MITPDMPNLHAVFSLGPGAVSHSAAHTAASFQEEECLRTSIPDSWPSPGLAATIAESRAFFTGKRALVTGAFGFVGGHLVRALQACGAQVTALDRQTNPECGSQIDLVGLREKIEVVEIDITDMKAVCNVVTHGRFDFIFHLAAGATTIEKAIADPYGTIMANTMGFVNFAECARRLPPEERPVVLLSSTDKVYGESDELPYDEEKSELRGVGVYDAAKLAADIFAATYHQALGLDTVVLRMCNLFGTYDFNTDYRLIPKAMRNIFRDHDSPDLYFSSLNHHRDYLYVEDAARAFLHLAREEKCRGHVFNLPGAHYAPTPEVLRDVVDVVARMQDDARRVGGNPALAALEWNRHIRLVNESTKAMTISKQHLSGEKIKGVTGFEPAVGFQEGLERTVRFYSWYFSAKEEPEVELSSVAEEMEHHVFETVPPNGAFASVSAN
jgi:nucleoside-diphosphate-sugar epimerase